MSIFDSMIVRMTSVDNTTKLFKRLTSFGFKWGGYAPPLKLMKELLFTTDNHMNWIINDTKQIHLYFDKKAIYFSTVGCENGKNIPCVMDYEIFKDDDYIILNGGDV